MSAALAIEERRVAALRQRTMELRALRLATPVKVKRGRRAQPTLWYDDVLAMVRDINKLYFSLTHDVYPYVESLARKHPDVSEESVRSHIRHQLQALREDGILFFHGGGMYSNLEIERRARPAPSGA